MPAVSGPVFGASMAYDDGLTLEQCRGGRACLIGRVNGQPTCCIDTRNGIRGTQATPLCPSGIVPFPHQEGDERLFGRMALKHLR